MSVLEEKETFGVFNYLIFVIVLVISALIGFYNGYKKNKSPEDFLLANRSFGPIPVAISLIASYLSAISLLGYSGEAYSNGFNLFWMLLGASFGVVTTNYTFLELFYPLQMISVIEYIDLRFKSKVLRNCILTLNLIANFLYLGICLYAPSIALTTVTKLNTDTCIYIIGFVCTLYSSIGGLRAVVWTDVFQLCVMVIGMFAVFVAGCVYGGGVVNTFYRAYEDERFSFGNFVFRLDEPHNIVVTFICGFLNYLNFYGVTQQILQRMCAVESLHSAKIVIYLNCGGLLVFNILILITGIAAYSTYAGCDPLLLGDISAKEQILPHFIVDKLKIVPGFPGLFVATLIGGVLSSLSTIISANVAFIWNDICSHMNLFRNSSQNINTFANKLISFLSGLIMIGMAILASKVKGLIKMAFTLVGAFASPIFGVFVIGAVFPHCDHKGALASIATMCPLLIWMGVGANLYPTEPHYLPFSIDECNVTSSNRTLNMASFSTFTKNESLLGVLGNMTEYDVESQNVSFGLHKLYSINFTYYIIIGTVGSLLVAFSVSCITGLQNPHSVPKELVFSFLHKYYYKKEDEPEFVALNHNSC